jgi:hypothetical protein
LNAADVGLLQGGAVLGVPVRLQTIKSFRKRGAATGTRSDFTNVQNSKPASPQHRLANFGFERTLEIMMLVWLWLEVLPCGRAAPIMRMRCTNEEKLPNPHISAFFRKMESG